jgi:hypothetical protein
MERKKNIKGAQKAEYRDEANLVFTLKEKTVTSSSPNPATNVYFPSSGQLT